MKKHGYLLIALLVLLGMQPFQVLAAGQGSALLSEQYARGLGQVTVMTWNVYLGADVGVILDPTDPRPIPLRVAEAYQMVLLNNFPERAATIAEHVAARGPHLIGLQEVSLIQRLAYPAPSGLLEELDYLQILLDALTDQGLHYQVAATAYNADITLPMLVGFGPGGEPILEYVRLRDSDVILARNDVQISNAVGGNYYTELPTPFPGVTIPRGYVAVDARVGPKTYRFVNTHLEAFAWQIRYAQAQELVTMLAEESLPIILAGDLNTAAPSSLDPLGGATYNFLVGAGYRDVWPHNLMGSEGEGFTSPHDADLRNQEIKLSERIDLVFVRNHGGPVGQHEIGPVQAVVVGDELGDRTPSGLWPSDHAGVVAKLHIRGSY